MTRRPSPGGGIVSAATGLNLVEIDGPSNCGAAEVLPWRSNHRQLSTTTSPKNLFLF